MSHHHLYNGYKQVVIACAPVAMWYERHLKSWT